MVLMRKRPFIIPLAVCLLVLLAGPLSPPPTAQAPGSFPDVRQEAPTPAPLCWTPHLIGLQDGLRTAEPLQRGEGLDFIQQPPILTTSYNGQITIRDLGIVGDFRTVKFHRRDHRRPNGVQVETWQRTRKQVIGGKTISRFTKSWGAAIFREVLRDQSLGWDDPQVFWGTLKAPVAATVAEPAGAPPQTEDVFIRLRLASKNLPVAVVRKINNRVQYSSHVVNLVVNNFSTARLTSNDSTGFAFAAAAKLFYQHFPDVYDGLSFVMQRDVPVSSYAAFHQIVRNQIGGIGRPIFNNAPTYGSGGKLKALEIYRAGHIATNSTSNHEAMHQWGDYFDITGIAGVAPAGHAPEAHMPLVFPRENHIGAVLRGERRVRRVGGDVYRIQRTPSPIKQHPLHEYAMGKRGQASVPNIVVFDNQGQFGSSSAAPEVDKLISGGSRIVTMNDIIGRHGPRTGLKQRVWRRATILISIGRLATQQEMNYWNFFAKRTGENTNTTSYEGFPSFRQSTGNWMRLRTDIDAKGRPKVTKGFQTTFRNFSPMDWRGIVFDNPVPSRFRMNQAHRFSGRVTLTNRNYTTATIIIEQTDGTSRRVDAPIVNGRFSANLQFPKRGNWKIKVILFFNNSGPQFPVTSLTGVIVT